MRACMSRSGISPIVPKPTRPMAKGSRGLSASRADAPRCNPSILYIITSQNIYWFDRIGSPNSRSTFTQPVVPDGRNSKGASDDHQLPRTKAAVRRGVFGSVAADGRACGLGRPADRSRRARAARLRSDFGSQFIGGRLRRLYQKLGPLSVEGSGRKGSRGLRLRGPRVDQSRLRAVRRRLRATLWNEENIGAR